MLRAKVVVAALAAAWASCAALGAVQTKLPDPPLPTFQWNAFGNFAGYANTVVKDYRNEAGTGAGPLYVVASDISIKCPDMAPISLGINNWQFCLWRGNSAGNAAGATNQVGAGFMGGFNLQNNDGNCLNYTYYQIYKDNANPNWVVDGGGINGKVNGNIPGYNGNPNGWNFDGANTQYDYFDIPSNTQPAAAAESVMFETALVAYMGNTYSILASWMWSFTSDGAGGVSGSAPSLQAGGASNKMMDLYGNLLPGGGTLQNVGYSSLCDCIPAPEGAVVLAFGMVLAARRCRAA